MTATATDAARGLLRRIRGRHWSVLTAAVVGGEIDFVVDPGEDPVTSKTLFQIGSITKTMTGVLLGEAFVRGEASASTTLGEVLGVGGPGGTLTLEDLATQRHGLPRLPPNLDLARVDESDPYAAYTEEQVLEAIGEIGEVRTGSYGYSNFAFMLLGLALGRLGGAPFPELLRERVFEPAGMADAICGVPGEEAEAAPGWSGDSRVKWWSTQLPGPGGVGAHIEDLGRYLRAHLEPDSTPLGEAIRAATQVRDVGGRPMGLGWHHMGGGWWHNGGTGGFRSFGAFHAGSGCAVALLANAAEASLDDTGFAVLTEMVRSRP